MGAFIWHQWARYVSLTSAVYVMWSGFWGLFYRKFFWDFIGGTLRNPGGLQPGPNALPFVTVIVKFPVVQIAAISLAVLLLLIEFPLPLLKGSMVQRTFVPRIVLLLMQGFLAALYYQGTNGAIYSAIAAVGYTRALTRGEQRESKEMRGEAERA